MMQVAEPVESLIRATRRTLHRLGLRATRRPRRYLSAKLGIRGFCEALESAGARYVVLRWFEELPRLARDEDLDLLVADEWLATVQRHTRCRRGIPCDVYTKSGLPGTRYREMAYYPPYLAERILARSVLYDGWCRVPCAEDHFFSLAYHAVYRKGPSSGLASRTLDLASVADPQHDYAAMLSRLASELGIDVEMTMEGLDELLADRGWQPPVDTAQRLAPTNDWLRRRFMSGAAALPVHERGLTVLFLRQEALEAGFEATVLNSLSDRGFNVLAVKHLSAEERCRCAQRIRGGDWGRGPFPMSGGVPAMAVAACDLNPRPPSPEQLERRPWIENGRIAETKAAIRREWNKRRSRAQRCNVLHSSDNALQAWEYVGIAMPERALLLKGELRRLHERFATRGPVLRDLTRNGRRAKIELIDFGGQPALRKTFRPGMERFCQREVAFLRRFAGSRPEFPQLLEASANSFVVPHYEDELTRYRRGGRILPRPLLPLHLVGQMVDVLRFIHAEGYGVVDAGPHNFLYSRRGGMKIIDFEFAYEYPAPLPFEDCYSFRGVPEDFDGDLPVSWPRGAVPYDFHWRPYVGLPLHSLLAEPVWLQVARRSLFQLGNCASAAARHVRRRLARLLAVDER